MNTADQLAELQAIADRLPPAGEHDKRVNDLARDVPDWLQIRATWARDHGGETW